MPENLGDALLDLRANLRPIKQALKKGKTLTEKTFKGLASKAVVRPSLPLERFKRGLKDAESAAGKSFKRIGDQARKAGLAFVAVGGVITAVIAKAIRSSQEQAIGIAGLDQALKNVGTSYDAQREKIEAVIEAQQRLTGHGDETQRATLKRLISLSGDYESSLAALPAVLDTAAALSIDLNAASNLVGRGLGGNTELFSRYGIVIEQGVGPQELINKLMEQFGGAAEASADPLKQAQNRLGDLSQVLGNIFLPAVNKGLVLIEAISRKLIGWAEENPRLVKTLAVLAGIFGGLLFVVGGLLIVVGLMIPALQTLVPILARIKGGMRGILGPIGLLITVGALLIANWDWVTKTAKIVWEKIREYTEKGVNFIIEAINKYTYVHRQALIGILKGLQKVAGLISKLPGVGDLTDEIQTAIDAIDKGIPTVDFYTKTVEEAGQATGELDNKTQQLTAEQLAARQSMRDSTAALEKLLSGYEEGKARTEALRTAEHDLERARLEQALAIDDQEDAQLSWNDAITKSKQLNADDAASQEDREAALRDVEAALRDLEQADNQLEAANAKVETTFQEMERAAADAAAKVLETEQAITDLEQSINDLHKELARELALDADTSERFNLSLTVSFAEIDLSDAETALQEAKDRFAEAMTPEETLEALIGVHDATEVRNDAFLAQSRALRALKDLTKERLGEIAEMRTEFRDNELTLQDAHNQDMREMEDAHKDALLQMEDDLLKARAQAGKDYMEDAGDWHEDHFKTLQGLEEDAARRRGQAIARYNQGQSAKLLAYQQDVETAERDHLQTLADIRRDARQSEEDAELDRQRSTEDANLEYQRSVEELHRNLAEEFFDTPDADILAAAGQVGARTDLIEALNEGLAELEIEQKQELEDIDREHGRTLEDIQIERRRKEAEAEQDWDTKRGELALAFQQKRLADETAHRNSLTAMQTESDRRIAEFKSASLEKLEEINKAHQVRLTEIDADAQTAVTERTVQYNKDRAIAQDTWDTESAARFEAHLETFTGLVDEWGGDMVEAVRTALQRAVDEAVRITPNVPPAQIVIPGKTSMTGADIFGPGGIAGANRNAARPMVPGFALGGLITSPTLLMAGERDTEAIIPLDRLDSLIGGGNRGTEIHIHGDLYGYDDFAQKVGEAGIYLDRGGRQKVLR